MSRNRPERGINLEPKLLCSVMNEPAQVLQNGADQAVLDGLRNEIILREIFGHFSSTELIQLSCVNKLWNREARSVMRERGNVIAAIYKPDLCVQVEAFGSALEGMNVVPFSAIGISLPDNFAHDVACQRGELRPICPESFKRLSCLKCAHMTLKGPWWSYQNCPAFQLAKIVLQHSSGSLEHIMLHVDLRQEDFIKQVFEEQKNCNFPRLRCLDLPEDSDEESGRDYASYIKPLVSGSPQLELLYIAKVDPFTGHALEGCTAATIVVQVEVSAPFDDIPENFIHAVRLSAVELFYTGPEFNFERFNRLAPVLLEASYSELASLYICPVLLPALMSYGVRLENVEEFFEMDINYSELARSEPRILEILKNFDFTRILPNLEKVSIYRSYIVPGPLPDRMISMIEEAEADLMEPMADRADHIQELILCDGIFEDAPDFWADTFPSIRKLRLGEDRRDLISDNFPIASIWDYWADVEELEVSVRDMRGMYPTADSAFCGIFPAECAELRQKDEEYLKRVNIVPVVPAITCFRNLKTFTLDYYGSYFAEELAQPELSKLTRLIAFGRCRPNVAIILKTRWTAIYDALRHMEPYASVILEKPSDATGAD